MDEAEERDEGRDAIRRELKRLRYQALDLARREPGNPVVLRSVADLMVKLTRAEREAKRHREPDWEGIAAVVNDIGAQFIPPDR